MEYYGAADFFFWQGIKEGFNNDIKALPSLLRGKFVFTNKVTKECTESFTWGFCFGLILTQKEYNNLTSSKIEGILVINQTGVQVNDVVINDEDLANTTLTGVC